MRVGELEVPPDLAAAVHLYTDSTDPVLVQLIAAEGRSWWPRPQVLVAVAWVESRFDRFAVSPAGAQGLYQFMPSTWAEWGGPASPFDVGPSTWAATRYLAFLGDRYGGDVAKAFAAYNWGLGNVDRVAIDAGPLWREELPRETAAYVAQLEELLEAPIWPWALTALGAVWLMKELGT